MGVNLELLVVFLSFQGPLVVWDILLDLLDIGEVLLGLLGV